MVKKYFALLISSLIISPAVHAQYCTAVGPSNTQDSNLQSFNLNGESGTSISFIGCPGVIGLDDQTMNENVVLNASGNYNASAFFGTCQGNYTGVGEGWIDYNQNQVFEPSESIGTWAGTPPAGTANWNFTVPAAAVTGSTRMRVVHFEGGGLPINPCATFTWGSTTDFTVQIGGGLDCTGYIGQTTSQPRVVSSLPYSENYSNAICYMNILTVYPSADVFYRVLPTQLGADFLTVTLCGSAIDTYLCILNKDGSVIYYNDDHATCGTSSKITFPCSTLDTVYVAVQGWGSQNGNYSILIEQELVSVDEILSNEVKIYPNPASGQVFISTANNYGQFEINDLSGKLVLSGDFDQSGIDIGHLSSGTYLISIIDGEFKTMQKLIVE